MSLMISVVLDCMFWGKVLARKVGARICVEIVVAAAVILSVFVRSAVIPGKTDDMMVTTSSEDSGLTSPSDPE